MKKFAVMAVVGWLALAGVAAAEPPSRHFFIGANAGSFPGLAAYGLDRFGAEIGVQVGKRWALVGEFAYGTGTFVSRSEGEGYSSESIEKFRSRPFGIGIHFITPVGETFFPYVGAGAEFFSTRITESWSSTYNYGESPTTYSESETYELEGVKPFIKVGIEGVLAGRFAIFGEIKQGVGRSTYEHTSEFSTSSNEIPVGGVEIKAGFRVYF